MRDYEAHKRREAERNRAAGAAGREIGPLPAVVDPARRERGRESLRAFAEAYFPARFTLGWSSAHLTAMDRLQACTDGGGQFALAMPRGSGKTTLAEVAALRAVLYGLRRFVLLVAATEKHAARALKRVQAELEANDLLLEDFPEACHPVRRLEGIAHRAKGQTLGGERTLIEWTADGVTLAAVPGAACAGATIQVAGLTGSFRGLSVLSPAGEPIRPDCVLLDDVQTRESSKSPTQTADREAIVADDVLGLAGPTTTIAAVLLCTVIFPRDLSDRFLDREKYPAWQGQRTRMLDAFPANLTLWEEYWERRKAELAAGGTGADSTAFYAANREAMDAGAVVTWPDRMKGDEISGVQSAMNLFLANPRGFKAEYQNSPDGEAMGAGFRELDPATVAKKLTRTPAGHAPREMTRVTAFVDCGKDLLWYVVTAWDERYSGAVLEASAWPRQGRRVFQAGDARPSLAQQYPGKTDGQAVYAGLTDLVAHLGAKAWPQVGGGSLRLSRLLVDSGWETDTVRLYCGRSEWAALVWPSKGMARGSTGRSINEWAKRPGDRVGWNWRLSKDGAKGRTLIFDPDLWKSFTADRLQTDPGAAGCLSLTGTDPAAWEMLAEHCAAEFAEDITQRGVTYSKWQLRPDRPDNHLWDCLVGTAVAASVEGLVWTVAATATQEAPAPPKARRSMAELAAAAAARRAKI